MVFSILFLCLVIATWLSLVAAEPLDTLLPWGFETNSPLSTLSQEFSDPASQFFKRAWEDTPNATNYIDPFEYGGVETLDGDLSERGELMARQTRCLNPGYVPCSNRPGYCSAPSYFCCTTGNWSCPRGTTCCGTRGCARPGYSCCSGGGACPSGGACCSGGCARTGYGCCPGGTRTCPLGGSCCNPSGCAPTGGRCCGTHYCTGSETCCNGQGCAAAGATCCGSRQCRAGAQCCNNGSGCSPSGGSCCGTGGCTAGKTCCSGRGCAPQGGTCCGTSGRSCSAGQKCCGGLGCSPSSGTCCGNGYCKEGKKCCVRNGRNFCANDCNPPEPETPDEEDTGIPTIIFPNLDMKDIFENMCRGIMKRGLVYGPQTDILTYSGGASATRRRRREAGCGTTLKCWSGSDPDQMYLPLSERIRKECDEYPFASTLEGGQDAHIGCVPWWQNSWQGIYYGQWLRDVGLTAGQKFRVVLAGIDCTTVAQSELEPPDLYKRQSTGETVTSGSTVNGTWLDPTKFGNLTSNEGRGAFMVPLPELQAGVYTIPFTLGPGNISAMAVYDADGEELARKNSTGSTDSLTFSLADDGVDAVLLAWASNQDVQLDYSARRTPLPSTSATSQIPQSTSQPSMGITRVHFVSSGLLFLCVVVIALSMTSLPGL